MDTCQTPLSMALSEHSLIREPQTFIEELRTSLRQASPVSPSPSPESVREIWMRETSGLTPFASLESSGPSSACWKTSQVSLLTLTSEPFSGTWPRAGMMLDGKLYQRENWERRSGEIGSGLWRSPGSSDGEGGIMEMRDGMAGRYKLRDHVQEINRQFWPTPRQSNPGSRPNQKGGKILAEEVKKWPTPTASERENDPEAIPSEASLEKYRTGQIKRIRKTKAPTLTTAVGGLRTPQTYPTPKVPSGGGQVERKTRGGGIRKLEDKISAQIGRDNAQLNPCWVAWLMNWPINWESLEPLSAQDFEDWLTRTFDGSWWEQDPADDGLIPRVTEDKTDRVARLKSLGNGQVPLCVAVAWAILTGK